MKSPERALFIGGANYLPIVGVLVADLGRLSHFGLTFGEET